jgi:hypothetical protein
MRIRGTTLRLTAVSTLVVLALTGFSSRHGGHGHGHSGGSGGGCSSSSQDHDSSSSSSSSSGGVSKDDYDSGDDSYGSGSYGGGSGGYRYRDRDDDDNRGGNGKAKSLDDATVELLDCASGSRPYSKVRVTNPNGRKGTFTVTVVLRADREQTLDTVSTKVEVPANGSVTAKVRLPDPSVASEVQGCEPEPRAPQAR